MIEEKLIRIYMELTGSTEPAARNVFMLVWSPPALAGVEGRNASTGQDAASKRRLTPTRTLN